METVFTYLRDSVKGVKISFSGSEVLQIPWKTEIQKYMRFIYFEYFVWRGHKESENFRNERKNYNFYLSTRNCKSLNLFVSLIFIFTVFPRGEGSSFLREVIYVYVDTCEKLTLRGSNIKS